MGGGGKINAIPIIYFPYFFISHIKLMQRFFYLNLLVYKEYICTNYMLKIKLVDMSNIFQNFQYKNKI